jgi:hypothetical protein
MVVMAVAGSFQMLLSCWPLGDCRSGTPLNDGTKLLAVHFESPWDGPWQFLLFPNHSNLQDLILQLRAWLPGCILQGDSVSIACYIVLHLAFFIE